MYTWNDFLLALVMNPGGDVLTAPLALSYFAGNQRTVRPDRGRRGRGARGAARGGRLHPAPASVRPRLPHRSRQGVVMASIKLAYLGGGSSRAPGTMAAFLHNHGASFEGSEVVLIDLCPGASGQSSSGSPGEWRRCAAWTSAFRATTDRRAGLTDVDAVLSSYRPGGFEARVLDERIPLSHGVIGQETQGPGGFFMALRSIHVLKGALADLEQVAPRARIFNYTNPVNIVAQAATMHSSIPFTSFCEGTYDFPRELADAAGLDRSRISARMIGLNHTTWSVDSRYGDMSDAMPAVRHAWAGHEG